MLVTVSSTQSVTRCAPSHPAGAPGHPGRSGKLRGRPRRTPGRIPCECGRAGSDNRRRDPRIHAKSRCAARPPQAAAGGRRTATQATDSTAKIARMIRPWCSSAARNAATTVGSSTFSPLFIPGMAPVTSRGYGPAGRAASARPDAVNVRWPPANAAEHDENVIVRAGGNVEPVPSAYYYDLSYMTPGGRGPRPKS